MKNILYSGGAHGADSVFALEEHLESVILAGKGLKRQVAKKPSKHPRFRFIRNLILRNSWQIWGVPEHGQTQAVYAVAPLDKFHRQVSGGTAWALEIALHQTEVPVRIRLKIRKMVLMGGGQIS